ncbi:MAG: glycosyltransferase [Pseudomonadota bacterium]
MAKMKIAIIHYWLINWRGGEKVIESLLEIYPEADVYTHVYKKSLVEEKLKNINIFTTFISKLPFATKLYQKYLPLMPIALEQLDLREYDIVISSESGPSKGVITNPDSLHICYCHTPMRYVWDLYPEYKNKAGTLTRIMMLPLVHYLKIWDRLSADRVDFFIANSKFVAKRIKKFYRRESIVIYPPVDIDEFVCTGKKSDYYLVLGQLTPYKCADLVVDAFEKNGLKLVVIGEGEQYAALKSKENTNISVLGRLPWDECKQYLSNAKALIFPGIEDFGMVPVEAMACGTPVLAYAKGGALETVKDGVSGYLFYEQSIESINLCVSSFENSQDKLDVLDIHKQAEKFTKRLFQNKIKIFIEEKIDTLK